MPQLSSAPPFSLTEPVTDIIHGVPVTDPYRWLEDPTSPRTRRWIEAQTRYARTYLDYVPGRDSIRKRIRELLAVETYDSLQQAGSRYFFRKRLPEQEQPCIYMRERTDGEDQLLLDPAQHGDGKYRAVRPIRVSPDGRLLLYEIKEGGERTGTFALLDIESRHSLPDVLPRGYLRGFAFAPDGRSFYYVHESLHAKRPFYRAAYQHQLGSDLSLIHISNARSQSCTVALKSSGSHITSFRGSCSARKGSCIWTGRTKSVRCSSLALPEGAASNHPRSTI